MRAKTPRRATVWAGILFLLSPIATMAVAGQGNNTPTQPANHPHFGQFQLSSVGGRLRIRRGDPETRTRYIEIEGPRVTITSASYDIAAQHLDLFQNIQTSIVTTGKARGNVRIEVREPDQVTVLTCELATYRYGSDGTPTRIEIPGSLRAVTKTPQLTENGPLILTGKSGYVEFDKDGQFSNLQIDSPNGSATPIEPAPKNPPKSTKS